MSDTVIRVENLSKKYVLGHQQESNSYKTFSGAMSNAAKSLAGAFNYPAKKDLDSKREEFWALKDVSFEIKQGDRVGVIGRNGAGKSTLLKVLSRITEPTTGSIQIKGRVASLLEVGTGFHPELTGRENIFLNGAILGMSKVEIQRKFDEIVAFAEIEKFLDTPVKRYSSGMYVRLAFAVAAHLEPEILIIDEVLAVGDAQFQKKCLGKMEEVGKEGRTILFVSHNMATVSLLCQTGLFFEKGRIVTLGSARDCIEAYVDQSSVRVGMLLNHQKVGDPTLRVVDARVNGISNDLLHLVSTDEPIEIEMKVLAAESCRVCMETRLKDREGNTLAVCLPGHMDAEHNIYTIQQGLHTLSTQVFLPKLNKGTYFLEIAITEPGFREYVSFPSGVELQVSGYCTKTGYVFEHSLSRDGFQVLDGSVCVKPS
jgi:lipopolysaccharide transport system ATP-binding protein